MDLRDAVGVEMMNEEPEGVGRGVDEEMLLDES